MKYQWLEVTPHSRTIYQVHCADSQIPIEVFKLQDERTVWKKVQDSFLNRFFPAGFPNSVADGYPEYSAFRAVQHFVSGVMGVLSTQSLLFAAGLRPTPAQATVISWVLKDGMGHFGKVFCSTLGPQMDAEPKRWRIFADALHDVASGLEMITPLCPQQFLPVAGIANLAKGMALVSARSTRLPIYSALAKEGNLSDLYAKGEAITVFCGTFGMALGMKLASGVCLSTEGKLVAFPILTAVHLYSVAAQMRAVPINTLNQQRVELILQDFLKSGKIPTPGDVRYKEKFVLPYFPQGTFGSVSVGSPLVKAVGGPSNLRRLKKLFEGEKFLLNIRGDQMEMVLHREACGEDAIKGWLLAATVNERLAKDSSFKHSWRNPAVLTTEESTQDVELETVRSALSDVEQAMPSLISGLKSCGWQTQTFLEGSGVRAVW